MQYINRFIGKLFFLTCWLIFSSHPGNASTPHPEAASVVSDAFIKSQKNAHFPQLNRDSTIAGTNLNAHGVRADVVNYINALPDSAKQKNALTQHAAALALSLTVNTTNTAALNAADTQLMNSMVCLFARYGAEMATSKGTMVEKITVNTVNRFRAYEKFNAAVSEIAVKTPTVRNGCDDQISEDAEK